MADTTDIAARLEELRAAIQAENISYGEIAELQDLAEHIDPGDVELLQWAGVPEHPDETDDAVTRPTDPALYSVDPDVLIPLIAKGEVNGAPVLDYGTGRGHVFVLCFLGNKEHMPFVTWDIWRTEKGVIAAAMGHYHPTISDAVIELRSRADGEGGLNDLLRDIEQEREGLRRQ